MDSYICLFAICISYLLKHLLGSFAHDAMLLLLVVVVFKSFCIFWIPVHYQLMCFENMFSHLLVICHSLDQATLFSERFMFKFSERSTNEQEALLVVFHFCWLDLCDKRREENVQGQIVFPCCLYNPDGYLGLFSF